MRQIACDQLNLESTGMRDVKYESGGANIDLQFMIGIQLGLLHNYFGNLYAHLLQ